jgi:DNA-binding IclR family transcriptional regulator
LDTKGQISEAELAAVGNAGFSDGEIAEIIAHVALNVFTNYFNIAAGVDIDFPRYRIRKLPKTEDRVPGRWLVAPR